MHRVIRYTNTRLLLLLLLLLLQTRAAATEKGVTFTWDEVFVGDVRRQRRSITDADRDATSQQTLKLAVYSFPLSLSSLLQILVLLNTTTAELQSINVLIDGDYWQGYTTLQTEIKITDYFLTFLDEIAGNMSNKCTFTYPNSPWKSRIKNELQYE